MCDDAIFVALCVNEAIANEMRWPSAQERRALASHIHNYRVVLASLMGHWFAFTILTKTRIIADGIEAERKCTA